MGVRRTSNFSMRDCDKSSYPRSAGDILGKTKYIDTTNALNTEINYNQLVDCFHRPGT